MRYLLMITMSLLRSRRTEEDHRASCAEHDERIALLPESRELIGDAGSTSTARREPPSAEM